jgi:hypothetical protein
LALHCLGLAGYETYFPRLRDRRIRHGRKIEVRPALFPGYCFLVVEPQWHAARWAAGVINLVMDGVGPAKVPEPWPFGQTDTLGNRPMTSCFLYRRRQFVTLLGGLGRSRRARNSRRCQWSGFSAAHRSPTRPI